MTENVEPVAAQPKTRRKVPLRVSDIIIFSIMTIVIVVLALTLVNKLQLKRDVTNAEVVSNKAIADISKRDGTAVRRLGNKKFQSTYSADQLTRQFNAIQIVTEGTPTIDKRIVSHGKSGKTVFILYKYAPKLAKQPFFITVAVSPDESGVWQLTRISGSADESAALNN